MKKMKNIILPKRIFLVAALMALTGMLLSLWLLRGQTRT